MTDPVTITNLASAAARPALRSHEELKALAEQGAAELGWNAPRPGHHRLGGP